MSDLPEMAEEISAAAVKAFEEAEALVAPVSSGEPAKSATSVASADGLPKKMMMGTEIVTWHDPETETGKAETEIHRKILTYYGMESLMEDDKKKMEMLRAFYHGTCQTHQTILQSAQCEPVRAILQTLAMRWLSKLVPDETRDTLNRLNAPRGVGALGSSILGSSILGSSGALGSSVLGSSGALGSSVLGSSGALGSSVLGSSGALAHASSPGPVGSPAPYYYHKNGEYIIITTDESTRALCADLESMRNLQYTNASLHEEAAAAVKAFEDDGDSGDGGNGGNDPNHPSLATLASAQAATQQAVVAEKEAQRVLQAATQQQDSAAIAAAQAALAAAQAEVVAAQADAAQQETRIRNMNLEMLRVKTERNDVSRVLAAKEAEYTQSRSELVEARASLEALEAQGAAASMADMAEREAAVARVQTAEAQVAEQRNASLAALAEARAQAVANVAAAHAEAQAQAQANIQRLRAEFNAAQAQNRGNKNAEIARLQEELATARAEAVAQAAAHVVEQEAAHAAAEASRVTAEAEATRLRSEAEASAEAVAERQASLEAAQRNSGNRSAAHDAEIEAMRQQLAEAQTEASRQAAEADRAHLAAMEAARTEAEVATQLAVAEARATAEAASAEAQRLAEEAHTRELETARTETRAQAIAEAARQAEQLATTAQEEAERIRAATEADAQRLTAELEAARSQFQNLSTAKGVSNAERNAERAASQAQIRSIQEELSRAQAQSVEAQAQSAAAQAEVASTRAASERAIQEARNSQADAEAARVEANAARGEAEAAKAAAESSATDAIAARNAAQAEAAASAELARVAQAEAAAQTAAAQQAQQNAEEARRTVATATAAKEVAAADVQRLNNELAAAQKAATQVGTNRNQSHNERNAARAEIVRIQADLQQAQEASRVAKQEVDAAREEKRQADKNALTSQAAAEASRIEAEAAKAAAAANVAAIRLEKNAANAARNASNAARSASNAARNAALRNVAEARREQEAARVKREAAEKREADLQVTLQEVTARSKAAALAAKQSTSATQAQRNQEAATAAAKQAEIQAELAAATAAREQREQEHQEAIAAAKKETETARQTVTFLQSQRNRANAAASQQVTAQQERIAQLEREIQEHNAAAEAKLAQLQQERNATLQERNAAEARAATELIATREQALIERNAAIAAAEAAQIEQKARIAEAQENARLARLERNAAQKEAREEQARLLAQHKNDLAAADAKRLALSEQHTAALEAGQTAYAAQLRQQQKEAEAAHQQALHTVMVEAGEALKGHVAAIAAEKKEQEDFFQREKAEWASKMEEVENNNLQLTSESRAAKNQAATAKREKEEAIAAEKEAAATAIAAAEAARQAAETTSAASRANRATALTAQREAETAAQVANAARAAAEEKAVAASAREADAQETARVAREAAQRATAEADAARATQEELEGQQAMLKQDTQALQGQLAAAEEAQKAASKKIEEVEQARAANAANAATQTAAQKEAYEAEKARLDAAVTAALAEVSAEKEKAAMLQASHDAKSAKYEAAAAEAKSALKSAVAQAAAEKAELETRHAAKMQETLETVKQSEERVEKIQADMEKTHAAAQVARSEQNSAHAAALQAQMVRLEGEKEAAIESLRVEKDTAVKALQSAIATHEAAIADLTARKEAAERGYEEATETVKDKTGEMETLQMQFDSATTQIQQLQQLQQTTNRNMEIAMKSNRVLIQNAIEEAAREKQRAEDAILLNSAERAAAIKQMATLSSQKVDLERQLRAMGEMVSKRLGVINLSAVPDPNLSFQAVSREAVNDLITKLTRRYFLPWRALLRHPIAIRAHDLREDDSMRECLQRFPLVTLFSPLPEEGVMKILLGPTYEEYQQYQENVSSANAASSGASSGDGNAMQIDILLYYLIIGLHQAPIINQSDDFVAINHTVEQIKVFSEKYLAQNTTHIDRLQNSCGVKLADEHNKDTPLLTFLYLSSKTPQLGNARFQYEIERRFQKSLKMTYSPTPTPFYDAAGREIKKGGDHKTYHYGPFTKIYPPTANSQAISHDQVFVDAVENRLRAGEAVTVIGYGASGSGKTTTLVYAKHNGQPGLLAHVANRLIQQSQAGNGFISCNVIIYELDEGETAEGQCRTFSPSSQKKITRTVLDKEGKATTYEIPVADCSNATPFSYTIQEGKWANASRIPLEKEIVEYIDTKRNTAPTPNNPQSSRSHVICVLTFSRSEARSEARGEAKAAGDAVFIVCDFAGVENTFMCKDPRVKETIGVKALINPMIKMKEDGVKQFMRDNIQDVREDDFILKDNRSSYLFGEDTHTQGPLSSRGKLLAIHVARLIPITPRKVADVFIDIENDRRAMYRLMDAKFSLKISGFTDFKEITRDSHPQGGPSNNLDVYKDFKDSYQRILALYKYHTTTYVDDGSGHMIKIKGEIDESDKVNEVGLLWHLVKILVWYRNSRIRYETLFQSLVTREYDPTATKVMTKTQIEAYPRQALCNQRVKEGVFINDSLKRLRSFISASVRKSLGTRAPPFLDECVPLQCNPHHLHCFGQGSREDGAPLARLDGGPLARLIEKSVVGKKNTFCIFTVVNLSRDANNPPPIPYVDIGPLLTLRESLYPLIPGKMDPPNMATIHPLLNGVYQNLQRLTQQDDEIVNQFSSYARRILQGGDDLPHDLEMLIQKLINHNAITTIGTIEFTDAMAKYGATQITCAPSFVQGQVKQIEQRAPASTTARGPVNQMRKAAPIFHSSVSLNNNTNGGFTRVRRKANRRTRKKRNT